MKPAFLGDYDAFTAMFDAALAARVPLDTLIDIHDAMAEHGVKHFFDLGLAANFTYPALGPWTVGLCWVGLLTSAAHP